MRATQFDEDAAVERRLAQQPDRRLELVDPRVQEVVVGVADPHVHLSAGELRAERLPVRHDIFRQVVLLPVLQHCLVDLTGLPVPQRHRQAVGATRAVYRVPARPVAPAELPPPALPQHAVELRLVAHGGNDVAVECARARPLEAVAVHEGVAVGVDVDELEPLERERVGALAPAAVEHVRVEHLERQRHPPAGAGAAGEPLARAAAAERLFEVRDDLGDERVAAGAVVRRVHLVRVAERPGAVGHHLHEPRVRLHLPRRGVARAEPADVHDEPVALVRLLLEVRRQHDADAVRHRPPVEVRQPLRRQAEEPVRCRVLRLRLGERAVERERHDRTRGRVELHLHHGGAVVAGRVREVDVAVRGEDRLHRVLARRQLVERWRDRERVRSVAERGGAGGAERGIRAEDREDRRLVLGEVRRPALRPDGDEHASAERPTVLGVERDGEPQPTPRGGLRDERGCGDDHRDRGEAGGHDGVRSGRGGRGLVYSGRLAGRAFCDPNRGRPAGHYIPALSRCAGTAA